MGDLKLFHSNFWNNSLDSDVIGDNNGGNFRLERKRASQKTLWDCRDDDIRRTNLSGCEFYPLYFTHEKTGSEIYFYPLGDIQPLAVDHTACSLEPVLGAGV